MTTPVDATTWIVGLDAGDRSRGALCCAAWLAAPEHTLAVHVLELWSRPYVRADSVSTVVGLAQRLASELQVAPPGRVTLVEAEAAEEGLAQLAEGAAGLIIGRAAARHEHSARMLGHVARRLLRRLPCPVVVAPPDLTEIAAGPVLLATDLGPASDAAVAFARDLAVKHGRELVVVHVGETRYSDLIEDLDPAWLRARDSYVAELDHEVHQWMARHALIGRHRLVHGGVVEELVAVADATKAAAIVVGSRRLGIAGRIFLGSTASTLAGRAPCPVAVVASA